MVGHSVTHPSIDWDEAECPLYQSELYSSGWVNEDVWFLDTHCFRHLVPCGDLRLHQLDPRCWCNPTEDDECPGFYVHNSADGRELYETGDRWRN